MLDDFSESSWGRQQVLKKSTLRESVSLSYAAQINMNKPKPAAAVDAQSNAVATL